MCARPEGQHTRGKTAGNRLRRVDTYVGLAIPQTLRGGAPLAVDLGFGARPWTTLELAERWRRTNPELRVLGVEIDPQRVADALPSADPPAVDFRVGGFDLANTLGTERARIVRCMNVLRQYDEAEVERALALIAEGIEPGGVLLEGTSDPTGRLTVFDVYRRGADGLVHETLVFATNYREYISPAEFRTRAPKRLIHRMLDETPARFFADWERAALTARASFEPGTSQHWAEAARLLAGLGGWPIDLRRRVLERGFLAVRSELR